MSTPQLICACRRNAASSIKQEKRPVRRSLHRPFGAAGWTLPSLGLALVPKCPMCIAAWLALAGGGVSVATAAYLHTSFVWLCWIVLAWMTVRVVMRFGTRPLAVLTDRQFPPHVQSVIRNKKS
jgi:hypothetical protein